MDVAFVRDIAGGVFCSAKVQGNGDGGREAYEYEYYNETIVRKTAYTAFKLAKSSWQFPSLASDCTAGFRGFSRCGTGTFIY